jgi:transcriptional regulator with XRE-family HTH domain
MKKSVNHLGKTIKRLRSFRGMTQEDLAKSLGKTRSLVSFFERTGNVNKYTLQEIATILSTTVEKLETGYIDSEYFSNIDTVDIIKDQYRVSKYQQLIDQQQEEINFLKETIKNQWELLKRLGKEKW